MKNLYVSTEMRKNAFSNTRPFRILVVEHDRNLCEMLSRVLHDSGFDYRIYSCLNHIIPVITEYQPDLVLMEYLSPAVNGGELCNQIKRNKLTNDIPVVIYSSFPKLLLSLGEYGYDEFIEKPFELSCLLRKIDELLKNRRDKSKNKLVSVYN